MPFDRGVVAINGELGVLPDSRFLGEPGDGPIETDVLGHQLEFQHEFNENWSALIGLNFRDTSLEGFATENQFFGSRQFLQIDGENLSRFRRFRDYDATFQVFRAEISGSFATGGVKHRLIVGLDSDEFENDQVLLRERGPSISSFDPAVTPLEEQLVIQQVINIFDPVYGAYPLPEPTGVQLDQVETQESLGLYIQDQISLTEKLDIRLGVRFDDYDQELINRQFAVGADGRVSDFTESRVSPQIGLVYQATDSLSFYAAYGENFRPLTGASEANPLDSNESESLEVGVKFSLNDGTLEGTVAIFDVDQSNISTAALTGVPEAIGGAGSQGIEIDLNGYITDSLSLLASYSFVDAETENTFQDMNFFAEVPAGSDLLNIPENQLTLQLVQQTQLAGRRIDVIGGLIYVDERNGFFSDQDFGLPSYTTVRVAANYSLSDSLALRAEVNNLFDREHFTNSFADVWVQPGTSRNFRLSADYRF